MLRVLAEAMSNIKSSKLRSFLSILGIVVGTGSVVALISSSQLATNHALAQFKTLGTNIVSLNIGVDSEYFSDKNFTKIELSDVNQLQKSVKNVELLSPYITAYKDKSIDDVSLTGPVIGVTESLKKILNLKLSSGRFLSDLDGSQYFCVVGADVAKKAKLASGASVVGQQVRIGHVMFTIVGVLSPVKQSYFFYEDLNNAVVVPLKSVYVFSSDLGISSMVFRVDPKANIKGVVNNVKSYINERFPYKHPYFLTPEKIISVVGKQRKTFSWLLGLVGSISLFVGGIGVMNIMLVSVVERKREIGVRMAVGAQRRDILTMFMSESVILTLFGGLFGVLAGVLLTFIIAESSGWGYQFFWLPPILSLLVSVFVGILSGVYPAIRASRLDPIQCLQSE